MTQSSSPDTPCPDPGMIQAYADGQLLPGHAAALSTHLATCSACQDQLAEDQTLSLWAEERLAPPAIIPDTDAALAKLLKYPAFREARSPVQGLSLTGLLGAIATWIAPPEPITGRRAVRTMPAVATTGGVVAVAVMAIIVGHTLFLHYREGRTDTLDLLDLYEPDDSLTDACTGVPATV